MSLVINSNIASLNSQRQLVKSGMQLETAMERLSSGKRINTAADDAAGLAISNRQTSAIRGLDRAVANANDGVSLIQTAEGALDETTNILQRMRELSIQSANGIYSDTDRATLDAEMQQLKAEVDRIAETTSFNGQKVLDGSLGDVALQVGSNANETITFTIGQLDADNLGGAASGDVVGAAISDLDLSDGLGVAGNVTINGQVVLAADLNTDATNMNEVLEAINSSVSGVEASAFTELTATADGTGILRGTDTLAINTVNADGTATSYVISDTGSMEELVAKINDVTGGVVSATTNDDGRLVLSSSTGAEISVDIAGTTTDAEALAATGFDTTATATGVIGTASISLTSTDGEAITVAYATAADALVLGIDARSDSGDVTGTTAAVTATDALTEGEMIINGVAIGASVDGTTAEKVAAINLLQAETGVVATADSATIISLNSVNDTEISIEYTTTTGEGRTGLQSTNVASVSGGSISDLDISTAAGAQDAIGTIDAALEQINSARSEMGAINNRLDFTVSNLMNVSENTAAARSRIVDADFAAETANLSRAQVLQQASTAMLAQANAAPQQVLSLLR